MVKVKVVDGDAQLVNLSSLMCQMFTDASVVSLVRSNYIVFPVIKAETLVGRGWEPVYLIVNAFVICISEMNVRKFSFYLFVIFRQGRRTEMVSARWNHSAQ